MVMPAPAIEEILEKLKARRKGAWDAEVIANELHQVGYETINRTRKEAFEEAIQIIKGKGG